MISDTTSLDSVSCQAVEALNKVILALQTEVSSASISTFHQQALERARAGAVRQGLVGKIHLA
ncbi:regulatory protein, LuxR [Pseudomonas syringae pv. solidagae]|uniref:Regulatory protein, LuxR n=1 Tax=Pseudomonas syringae pv. solidagae TaxID=264458 RepID=A0A0Q0FCY2_PSESX|nr:hypothetical protein [Pseudomonas syringae]KPY62228.1 regulatory protein, LuxR [Pseudomonas syringae pv. solidagae]RMT40106.1 Regulatory protein, LuxR [Pseudomonas syringae pv. solidagae]RMT49006.1 Regulatory protein, LuxR [Pseudomonas syringae pv. solidagae]